MKTIAVALLLVSMVLAACAAPAAPEPTTAPGLLETQVAGTVAALVPAATTELPTPQPSNTPLPPTKTSTPQPSDTPAPTATSAVIFRDDFDGGMLEGWTWLRENKQRVDFQTVPGFLRISLNPKNCGGAIRNAPLYPAPQGNFEISTFVEFTPIENFQFAGLMIFQDDRNTVKLGRAFCNASTCAGNAVYFDLNVNGVITGTNFATSARNPSKIHLRLTRNENEYSGYFSDDGLQWNIIGKHTSEMIPASVGLFTGQSCGGSIPADFSFFEIQALP